MHKTIAICLIAFCVMPLWPGTSTVLPELMRPTVVEVDASQNKIFIVDNTSVLVYSLNDLKLFKKIGRKGEGPQEFKYITSIHLLKKSLLVNSSGKISLFKKTGPSLKKSNLLRELILSGSEDSLSVWTWKLSTSSPT